MSFERPFRGFAGWARSDAPISHRPSFLRGLSLYSNIAMTVRWQIAIGGNPQQIGRRRFQLENRLRQRQSRPDRALYLAKIGQRRVPRTSGAALALSHRRHCDERRPECS